MQGSSHYQELIAKADVVPVGHQGCWGQVECTPARGVQGGQVPAVAVAPILDLNALSQGQRSNGGLEASYVHISAHPSGRPPRFWVTGPGSSII